MKRIIPVALSAFILLTSMASPRSYPAAVEAALKEAGSNRPELQKAIDYFKKSGDPLKLKAIYFLIANMDIHSTEDYYWVDKAGQKVAFNEFDYPTFDAAVKAFDKIKAAHPGIHPKPVVLKDIQVIKADFLIKNVESAFAEWQSNPIRVPFDAFCEYILPYRVDVEPLQDWREVYHKKFKWIAEEERSKGLDKTLEYAAIDYNSWFWNTYGREERKEPLLRLGALQLLFRKKGPCEDIADLEVFTLRSQGIAAAFDYIPYWATSTGSHFMNTAFDGNMHPIPFDAARTPALNSKLEREPSKVLRITYSKQADVVATREPEANIPPGFLRNRNYIDVTNEYWPVTDVSCKLFPIARQPKTVYVTVLNNLHWQPTWWAPVSHGTAAFKNMCRGAVFLPVYYINGKIVPAGYPIAEGYHNELVLKPDLSHRRKVRIADEEKYLIIKPFIKYSLYYWDGGWKLLGVQRSFITLPSLQFANVPRNALLLLVPENSNQKQRPFIITDDGKRVWW